MVVMVCLGSISGKGMPAGCRKPIWNKLTDSKLNWAPTMLEGGRSC